MTLANPATTPIARSKTAALSRILDSVPKGYVYYTAGECPAGKLETLARKFHERYGIGCSPAQRITRKQKGLANAVLVLYLPGGTDEAAGGATEFNRERHMAAAMDAKMGSEMDSKEDSELDSGLASGRVSSLAAIPDSRVDAFLGADSARLEAPRVRWLLLATEGAGPVHEQEQLRSVLDSRRLVFLGYELVRYSQRGKTSWTWRRTKQEMADLHALLASQLNARQTNAVAQTLLRIGRQPGFSGVRKQSWKLCDFARSRG